MRVLYVNETDCPYVLHVRALMDTLYFTIYNKMMYVYKYILSYIIIVIKTLIIGVFMTRIQLICK